MSGTLAAVRHQSARPPVTAMLAWIGGLAFPLGAWFMPLFDGEDLPMALLPVPLLLPLGLLRRHPRAALICIMVGLAAVAMARPETLSVWLVTVLADVAVATLVVTRPTRESVVIGLVTIVVQVAVMAVAGDDDSYRTALPLMLLALLTGWVVGYAIRQQRQYAEAHRVHQASQVTVAVQNERLRIARDLHDMVAHSIGVIAVQAGAGRRVIDTRPDRAADALAVIEDTSRETLAGLRRVLDALRAADQDTDPPDQGTGPAPGLDDLDSLVATTARTAGVRVELQRTGTASALPPDIDLAAYRIVQEAVTNVIRHAGTDRCQVLVDMRADDVFLEVTDHGHGGTDQRDPASGFAAGSVEAEEVRVGYGIPGMRERVALLHGEFTAQRRSEGGFVVAARLPLPRELES